MSDLATYTNIILKKLSNVTTFSARSEQLFLRPYFYIDNKLRSSIRKLIPSGLGSKHIYSPKQ
jgi:hypothetical protein